MAMRDRCVTQVSPGQLSAVFALVLALLTSCGGSAIDNDLRGNTHPKGPGPEQQTDELRGTPSLRPEPQLDFGVLPAVADIEATAADKLVSIIGPGYREIPLTYYTGALNMATVPGPKLESNTLPPYAFAAYSLNGFTADTFPTDLKVTTEPGGGEYWVAFADFESLSWTWNGPFNATAQVEIPFAGKPGGLHDFVSQGGRAGFLILAQEGESVVFSGLELGVDGGDEAPEPPQGVESTGGAGGLVLRWVHSLSFGEADFAGYLVERAPLLGGEFAALNTELLRDTSFVDTDAVLDIDYRYRVGAVDTSGNRSFGSALIDGPVTGVDSPPVMRVKFNPGPYQGETTVDFDFSGSFDPDGTAISELKVNLVGTNLSVTGLSEIQSITLPPGCFIVELSVTSNALTTDATYLIKVYPKWNSAPVTVAAPADGNQLRLRGARMRYLPGGQTLAVVGHDQVSDALVIWSGTPGGSLKPTRIWTLLPATQFEEPILYKDYLFVPLVSNDICLPLAWNSQTGARVVNTPVPAEGTGLTKVSAVTDGSTAFLVSGAPDGANFSVNISKVLDSAFTTTPVVGGLAAIEGVSAAYNAGADAIDIVYADGAATHWLRWSLDSQSVVDGEMLAAMTSNCIDVEIDPSTGEPTVAYYAGGKVRYRAYSGAAWSAEEQVEPVLANFAPFDLRFAHGTRFCYFAVDTGYSALYEYDEGAMAWTQRNSPAALSSGGAATTILNGAQAGEILALDQDTSGDVRLLSLKPGDVDSELDTFPARAGYGLQLQASAGGDGLHVVHKDKSAKPHHLTGTAIGNGWSETMLPWMTVESIDIAAQVDGEVYLSLNNADGLGAYQLEYWDPMGGMFMNEVAPIVGTPSHHPFMGELVGSSAVGWTYFDVAAGELKINSVSQMGGLSTVTEMVGTDPIWRGAMSNPNPQRFCVLRGGMDPWDGALELYDPDLGFEEQYPILIGSGPPFDLLTGQEVDDRAMEGAVYMKFYNFSGLTSYVPSEVYALAQGPLFNSALIDVDFLKQKKLLFIDEATGFSGFFEREFRRTASATTAAGATAVFMISTLGAEKSFFQWSNFGDWEDLPLPTGIQRMNRPELVVGTDYRWHIIYHDWATDELKCISTQ